MNDESGIIKSKWSRVALLSVWAAIALAFLVVYAADLRLSYDLIASPCVGPGLPLPGHHPGRGGRPGGCRPVC